MTRPSREQLKRRLELAEEALERFVAPLPKGYFAIVTVSVHNDRKFIASSIVSAQLLALDKPANDDVARILGHEVRTAIARGTLPEVHKRMGTTEQHCGNCAYFNQKAFCPDPEDPGAGGKCIIEHAPPRWTAFGDICDAWKEDETR